MLDRTEIVEAIRGDAFVFHYQPTISLVTGKVYGAEALARLIRPDGVIVQPDEFIPVAEQSGLINELTSHLFFKLLEDLRSLNRLAPQLLISFNVSASDLEDGDFTQQVLQALKRANLPADALQIELTETAMLEGGARIHRNVLPLRDAGVGLAMDDFGKGYSSLETLSKWPFSTIKLDQSLVSRMFSSDKNMTIVETSIRMAHELGIHVVAEGVETYEQYHRLLEAGCTRIQGYWISKPLPLPQYIAFVKEDIRWSGLPVGLIHMAIVDHVQWRRKLVSELVRAASFPEDSPQRRELNLPPLSTAECKLGRWYDGVGQMFAERQAFRDLAGPHRELHDVGAALAELAASGAEHEALQPGLRRLSECSAKVLELLHALEFQGMQDMHRALGEWITHTLHPSNLETDDLTLAGVAA
jgi:EAL domain-containing protein (putative c-di-GMP-specific phosphodiesterase class I)